LLSSTRQALEAFDNQHDFERLAADVLNGLGYQNVEPMAPGGGADGGCDIKFKEGGAQGIGFVTLEKSIKDKFRRDLSRLSQGQGLIALFCSVDVSPVTKASFAKDAAELGYTLAVFDLERLRSLLDGRFQDVRRRYLHIDDEVAEQLRSSVKRLLRFPDAVADHQQNLCLMETLLTDQMPRRLFELLMQYDEQDVVEMREIGLRLHEHMAAYHGFRQSITALETDLMQRLPSLWNPPLPGALNIHARYCALRFAGMTAEELRSGVNFLNYEITWDRAEKVFEQLATDGSLASRFEESLQRHARMSTAVKDLASNAGAGGDPTVRTP
jgi:hypothetical protein